MNPLAGALKGFGCLWLLNQNQYRFHFPRTTPSDLSPEQQRRCHSRQLWRVLSAQVPATVSSYFFSRATWQTSTTLLKCENCWLTLLKCQLYQPAPKFASFNSVCVVIIFSLMTGRICFDILAGGTKSALLYGPSVMRAPICLTETSLCQECSDRLSRHGDRMS